MEISEFGQRRSNSRRIYPLSISYGYQQKSQWIQKITFQLLTTQVNK